MKLHFPALLAAIVLAASLAQAASPQSQRAAAGLALQMPSRVAESASRIAASFRAPQVSPRDVANLSRPEKQGVAELDAHGRYRIATVRALEKAAAVPEWTPVADGSVSTLRASSTGSKGLRVALDVANLRSILEVRVQGSDGNVESMVLDPTSGSQAWTPWTDGDAQVIELFSPSGAPLPAASVASILHFDASPIEKATAGTCTVPASCTTNDATLDAAIAERVKSLVRISFVDGGSGFLCSATLLNTDRFPAGYLLTANHCISSVAAAGTVTSFWFYDPVSCADPSLGPGMVQLASGTGLAFTNYNADSTLLIMNDGVPAGATYSGWNSTPLVGGESVVSLSHPKGDTARLALGNITSEYRITDRAQDEWGVAYSRGIIEGGSSGSGLFTLSGGSLQLRGVLTGTTLRSGSGLSCTNLNEEGLYGRFDIFYAEMLPYASGSGAPAPDDAPNRVQDYAGQPLDTALNDRTIFLDRRIETVGDVDVYRFNLSAQATVSLSTQGTMDTIGTLINANGAGVTANDDASGTNTNFAISRDLGPGTYYLMVAPWDPNVTGNYRLVMSATTATTGVDVNYTDLWWAAENGWGINLAHQGTIVFATLYTYDTNGSPMWLFMSNGDKQSDGSFFGTLYRSTGTPFSSGTWSPITTSIVGTMRLTFTTDSTAVLNYTVNGVAVQKLIRRTLFATPATACTWTTGDRTAATNYQDLWWNPNESGWGATIAQQGNTMFALLYVYDTNGQALWLSMSSGALVAPRTFSGQLFTATGPAFNTSPWTSVNLNQVGTATFTFSDGENGTVTYTVNGVTVTKSIRRTVFANPKPICSSS